MAIDWLAWVQETERSARPLLDQALAAGRAGTRTECLLSARKAADVFLSAYLRIADPDKTLHDADLIGMLEIAVACDAHFERLRPEVRRLATGNGEADCESILDALKEVRLLAGARGGRLLGASMRDPGADPRLAVFAVHSTPVMRAPSIFAAGALYSYNCCVELGLISAPPLWVQLLLDPRRCLDYVLFHVPDHRYCAGEKVANSHRKGYIDEALTDDYQPSVMLFFREADLTSLPGYEDDGVFYLAVRDRVSLELLAYAVFPNEAACDAALKAVSEHTLCPMLEPRCLVAPAETGCDPKTYVSAANGLVAHREGG